MMQKCPGTEQNSVLSASTSCNRMSKLIGVIEDNLNKSYVLHRKMDTRTTNATVHHSVRMKKLTLIKRDPPPFFQ